MAETQTQSQETIRKATVLGGGAFGTAMAQLLASNQIQVTMWVREPEVVESINKTNENITFLKGIKLLKNISATQDLLTAVKEAELIMLVIPTAFLRRFIIQYRENIPSGIPIVCCSKGIENNTLLTPYEILVEELPGKFHNFLAALSGPSFAKEVSEFKPTNVTVASHSAALAQKIQKTLSNRWFRVYTSSDMIGAELCGALKNVIAIACGASDGFGFGLDARAALITRGLAEISRLVVKKGGNHHTMMGLCGVGDLVLTCTGNLSRNWQVGNRLAKGESIDEIQKSMQTIAEGVNTAYSVHQLATSLGVDMPICEQVYRVIFEKVSIKEALGALQSRPLRSEL